MNETLDRLEKMIKNPFVRRKIRREMREHLEDAITYYEGLGFSNEKALSMALSDLGDIEDIADSFNRVYCWRNVGMKLMKFLFVLLLGLLFFYLWWQHRL